METRGTSAFANWLEEQAQANPLPVHSPLVRSDLKTAGSAPLDIIRMEPQPGRYVQQAGDECTLQLIERGRKSAIIDHGAGDFRTSIMRGALALSPPRERIVYDAEASAEVLLLALPGDMIRAALEPHAGTWRDFAGLHQRVFRDKPIEILLRGLWEAALEGSPEGRLFADGAVLALIARLAQLSRDGRPAHAPTRGGLAPRQLTRVTEFLDSHMQRDVRLSEVAEVAGLSTYHFCRAFKQSTGVTPHMWLTQRRLERARHLMTRSRLTLEEVALSVGYSNSRSFSVAFRREFGVTPHIWQRERFW